MTCNMRTSCPAICQYEDTKQCINVRSSIFMYPREELCQDHCLFTTTARGVRTLIHFAAGPDQPIANSSITALMHRLDN